MTVTHIDPDRLTDLATRAEAWGPEAAAHLESCAECRLELKVIRVARGIGAIGIPPLDARRVMMGVRSRLAKDPAGSGSRALRHPGGWLVGLAAAAAVLLAVRMTVFPPRGGLQPGVSPDVEISTLHELDDLSAPELEAVLQAIPPSTAALGHGEIAPLGELSASDLERVLRSMED